MLKRIKQTVLVFIFVIAILQTVNVYAALNIQQPKVSSNDDTLELLVETNLANDYINVEVFKPGKYNEKVDYSELESEALAEAIEYIEAAESGSDAKFERRILLTSGSGEYIVRIRTYEGMQTFSIFHGAKNDLNEIKAILNSTVTTVQQVKNLIFDVEKYNKALRQDDDLFMQLTDKTPLYEMLLANAPYTNNDDIHAVLNMAAIVQLINQAIDGEDIKTLLTKNEDIFKIMELREYAVFNADYLKPEYKTALWESMKNGSYKNIEDVREKFADMLILIGLQHLEDRTKLADLFRDAGIDIEYSKYKDLTTGQQLQIAGTIINGTYSTAEEAANAMKALLYNLTEDKKSKAKITGGGSSGSSSSGSSYSVTPVIIPQPQGEKEFPDLGNVSWAKEAIEFLSKKGIISGYEDGSFKPNNSVTRGEFVKLVIAVMNMDTAGIAGIESPFNDVRIGDWYYPYVMIAHKHNIVRGVSETYFGANVEISRQDAACLIFRALNVKGIYLTIAESSFVDHDKIADYARDAVGTLTNSGIISGMEDNTFAAREMLTRAQSAQLIYKLYKLMESGGIAQ